MADTNGKIKYLGMEGVEALLDGLKGEYSPLEHEHDVVIKAENAENATNAEHANEADHATNADTATQAEQDGQGNVIADTYVLKAEAVLTTEQELTDEQKAIARNNIKSFGYNWHFLYSNCYCANIPENESITDWDNALSVLDSNNIPQLHNLVSHVRNLLRGDDNRIAKYNVVPNFISSVTALVDAGVFTLPMKLCGTFMTNNIDDPTSYLYFNISYTESKNRWIITNLSTSKMVIIVDGVVTTDQTLTYPDKSLSISDRTADAKAVGDALALKMDLDAEFITIDDIDEICTENNPLDTLTVTHDGIGNVAAHGNGVTVTHDGNGNVTLIM